MQTIIEGNKHIRDIWGKQNPVDTEYRLLKYILRTECEDGTLLHNVVTGQMILLGNEETSLIDSLPAMRTEQMDDLISARFLVPIDFNEKKSVQQLRQIVRATEHHESITGYTILPTTGCNARCFYCYESDFKHVSMTEETAHNVVEYMTTHCPKDKTLHLNWFGGEPLVGMNRIDQICNELQSLGYNYKSSMISNAYLFDQEVAFRASELWHLNNIQITLDGTEQIYNQTKAYVGITENAYARVINNIGYLLDQKIAVSVRLNLGRHNEDDLYTLIDELASRYAGRRGFSIYVGVLFNDLGFEPVHHSAKDREELGYRRVQLEEYIESKNCKNLKIFGLPNLQTHHCMADNDSSCLINPNGETGRCEHHVFDQLTGDILTDTFDRQIMKNWKATKKWDKCDACALYPKCVLLNLCEPGEECLDITIEYDKKVFYANMKNAWLKWQTEDADVK